MRSRAVRKVALAATVIGALAVSPTAPRADAATTTAQYIVSDSQGTNALASLSVVAGVGGAVVDDLDAADGVLANLTSSQVSALAADPGVTITPNLPVSLTATTGSGTASGYPPSAVYPQQSGATQLWAKGDSGAGVNVALVDTGIDPLPDFAGRILPGIDLSGNGNPENDQYGHGTFVAGLIAGDGATSHGQYKGEAPGAGLVPVKVAGASGSTTIATIIQGIDWVIDNHVAEHIGVMNLSLGYFADQSSSINPLDQAVERAWDAGIVVVASAGNDGPFNGTVLSPGDDPMVITVGAINDHGSPSTAQDAMAPFSSAGPTDPDGWFKPDLVTSGTSVVSLAAPGSTVVTANPTTLVGAGSFVGSGTSFSAAVTSGAVALLLAAKPYLTPDYVKALLLGTAGQGPVGDPFVDGHGILNVAGAASPTKWMGLSQRFGQVSLAGTVPASTAIFPGSAVTAGYSIAVPGTHPALTTTLSYGEVDLQVACSTGGAPVGGFAVNFPTQSYSIGANSTAAVPLTPATATVAAPNLCNGSAMYPVAFRPVTSNADITATDTTDDETVQFFLSAGAVLAQSVGSATVAPVATTAPGQTVNLLTTWTSSSWDPANWWAGAAYASSTATTDPNSGGTWTGAAWNGTAWSSAAWSSSRWNGSTWDGATWSGSAWNSSRWNSSRWNGEAWNSSRWNDAAWTAGGPGTDSATMPPASATASPYPGYSLASSTTDLWCPTGVALGKPGQAGTASSGAGGAPGAPGCGSNGGNGGNGGTGTASAAGGAGGNGGNGGCPPSTDAQMAAGIYPCAAMGASGGNGGPGGTGSGSTPGGAGGNGGNGGASPGAAGGPGGSGAAGPSSTGGAGGTGGGCDLYTASYWVSCPAVGGAGGAGGTGGGNHAGGAGGNGGNAGASIGAAGTPGAPGLPGTILGNGLAGGAGLSA